MNAIKKVLATTLALSIGALSLAGCGGKKTEGTGKAYDKEVMTPGKLVVHTLGNFEVLYNGTPLVFEREKAKELLALLIDRQGLSMTNGEIEAFLWEELHSPQYLQTLFYSLRKTLRGIGFEDLLIRTRNHTSIDVSKLHCDLYEFLKGSADAVNSYAGEYMNNYSWAELTNARLYNGTFSDFVLAAQARPRR